MFNVLPQQFKDEIVKNYRFRLAVVVCAFVIALQISGLVFLVPTWIISYYREADKVSETESMKSSSSFRSLSAAEDVIKSTNSKVSLFLSDFNYPPAVPLLRSVIIGKPYGVKVTGFLYSTKGASGPTLSIHGTAKTRESLSAFAKKLKDSGTFSQIDIPISNFTKDKDLPFDITATLASK